MPYTSTRSWALCACLLLLSACAPTRPHSPIASLAKPRLPSAALLQLCQPTLADADDTLPSILTADTINRDRHAACQRLEAGQVLYLYQLLRDGILLPPEPSGNAHTPARPAPSIQIGGSPAH